MQVHASAFIFASKAFSKKRHAIINTSSVDIFRVIIIYSCFKNANDVQDTCL